MRTQEAIRAKEAQQEEDRKRADEKTKERLQRSEANKLRLESERQEQLKRERELRDQATLKAKQTKGRVIVSAFSLVPRFARRLLSLHSV